MAGADSGKRPISGLGIVALICGIVWVFGLGSVLAVLLGHLALRRIGSRDQRGRWTAVGGLVLGYLGLFLLLVLLLQGGVTIEEDVPH
ncbi:protein of unknown function [Thermomonospora echinospora]|uniref:DUF4190 domain-containing protein n=1 Tax=Thermomonospora echinospora TaxID=1992 RepID=A0A1H6DCM2_9ACTN|nr:DUF4190 domain-containing protein [Thermomonospora echinospora]SEG82944.1 protein of unknown function [Thermomonospora echinospora]